MSGLKRLRLQIISFVFFCISLKFLISLITTCYYEQFSYTSSLPISLSGHCILQDWKQFVSIGNIISTELKSNDGTHRETFAGQHGFKLLIHYLLFDINSAKYVADITMSSSSTDPNACSLQSVTDHSCPWYVNNGMHTNEKKT